MRLLRPVPLTLARLTPNSRARRRTTGDACAYSLFSWKSDAFAAGAAAGASLLEQVLPLELAGAAAGAGAATGAAPFNNKYHD